MQGKVAGAVALLSGLVLLAISVFVSFFLYQSMSGLNGHRWNGSPEMTRHTIGLMLLLLTFGCTATTSGALQLYHGKPNRWLARFIIVLAIALMFSAYHIVKAG